MFWIGLVIGIVIGIAVTAWAVIEKCMTLTTLVEKNERGE